jgi:outer membrane beta-barrel protein
VDGNAVDSLTSASTGRYDRVRGRVDDRLRKRRCWPSATRVLAAALALSWPWGDASAHARTNAERDCEAAEPGQATPPDPDADAGGDEAAPADDPSAPTGEPPPMREPQSPAEVAVPQSTAEALGRTPRRVKCLDESLVDEFGRTSARKGVQPRTFRKARRLAIGLSGGVHAGDLLDTQWMGGADLAFWPTEEFGFEGVFRVTPMTLRLERAATNAVAMGNRYADGVRPNLAYEAIGHLMFAPIHTKLRARKDRIVHGDFVLLAGAGAVLHRTVQGAAFEVGMALYLFPKPWLSVKLELVDQILAQEALGSRRITNNLLFSVGVDFWIPPRPGRRQRAVQR